MGHERPRLVTNAGTDFLGKWASHLISPSLLICRRDMLIMFLVVSHQS